MACIQQPTEEEQRHALKPPVRNEIVRVLATQIFCIDPKPKRDLITAVAKNLTKKYPFMKDVGEKVSGYVSDVCMFVCVFVRVAYHFTISAYSVEYKVAIVSITM